MRIALVLLLCLTWNAQAEFEQKTSTIEGAIVSALVDPDRWNKKLLVIAHGYVPDDRPLTSPLEKDDPHVAPFLETGWMVAGTSYRRNGIIIRDAITDLELLYEWVEAEFGTPELTMLHGGSMGGMIVTLIAEQDQNQFDAVLATGAALGLSEETNPLSLNHQPRIPLLFLSNRSEIEGPQTYQKQATNRGNKVALWRVDRDGHVNLNPKERYEASMALEAWLANGTIALNRDCTIDISPQTSNTKLLDQSLQVPVKSVNRTYGNLLLDLIDSDLKAIGANRGETLILSYRDQSYNCLLGTTYGDVQVGEWVLFKRADGNYLLSRNFANAADTLKIAEGDSLRFSKASGNR